MDPHSEDEAPLGEDDGNPPEEEIDVDYTQPAKEPEVKAERWIRTSAQQEPEQPRIRSPQTDPEYFRRITVGRRDGLESSYNRYLLNTNDWKEQWIAFWNPGFERVFRVQELFEDRPDIIEMFMNKALS